MEIEKVLELVKKNVTNRNLFKHCLAVEAIMRTTARELNTLAKQEVLGDFDADEEKWAITGLVHDIDYDMTADDPARHSVVGAKMLEENGFDEEIVYAVKAHNEYHGLELLNPMDIALYAADPLSGLIVASALINPAKKLKAIDTQFVLNRFKEKLFAKGANRGQISACAKLGIELERFIEIGLKSMQEIDTELGL